MAIILSATRGVLRSLTWSPREISCRCVSLSYLSIIERCLRLAGPLLLAHLGQRLTFALRRVQVLDLRLNKYNVEVAQHMAAAIDRNSKLREFGVGQTVLPIRSIRDDKVSADTVRSCYQIDGLGFPFASGR